jgi:hypothetical protein
MRVALVILAALAVGCSDKILSAPEGATLVFTSRTPEANAPDSATAVAGQGQITVRATLSGPDPCRVLDGDLDAEGKQLILRVSVRPVTGVCVLVVGRFAYDATIEGLTPGSYTLQVIHSYPSTGLPTVTVVNQTLDVK